MNDYLNSENALEIDEAKAAKLMKRIIISESRNIKSGEKSETQMIKDIKKMIEEEVNCY